MNYVFQEHDLEQKIEVEIKMREGSARLLAAAKHRAQSLEAAKALLTSNERMSVYMAELQSRRRESIKKPWFVLMPFFLCRKKNKEYVEKERNVIVVL